MDGGFEDAVLQAVRYQEVVDSPAGIVLPCVEHIAPPGVGTGLIRVQVAEGIGESIVQQTAESGSLLIREAGITTVGGWVLQVDFLMGYVQIAADNHWLPTV